MVSQSIELLSKETIDQIAAGEVVERPASVVKELTENAIDAGADTVTIEIREGGKRLIRVTDNGSGIPADQIRKAFLRHATSKIRRAEDLTEVTSLGFRGEALSSIAAVARAECITKTQEALTGIRYVIEGGEEKVFEEVGSPQGTTFLVRDLFWNTPAREKFLKTPATEAGYVRGFVEGLALSHPNVSFTYIQEGRTSLVTDGRGDVQSVVYQIYGREIARDLIPFHAEETGIRVSGYLGASTAARGNRAGELFFVNGRPVKDDMLSKAAEDGYHGWLMQHRYPFVLLYLNIDGNLVDVNVHPTKKEVRFSDKEKLYRMLCLAIQNALMSKEQIPEAVPGPEKASEPKRADVPQNVPEPFELKRRVGYLQNAGKTGTLTEPKAGLRGEQEKEADPVREMKRVSESDTVSYTDESEKHSAGQFIRKVAEQSSFLEQDKVISEQARRMHRLIGQVFGTYWLLEYGDSLYIVDQHAAHEKVLYEKLMKQYSERTITSQMLYPAAVIEPGPAEAELLRRRLPVFEDLGYEIEEFGGDAFKIAAVPANLYRMDPRELFTDILDQMKEIGDIPAESIAERLASMSCKAAVKGNTSLSFAEADALMDELLGLKDPYHCPHGRPTIIRMTRTDLDKKFRRIV